MFMLKSKKDELKDGFYTKLGIVTKEVAAGQVLWVSRNIWTYVISFQC